MPVGHTPGPWESLGAAILAPAGEKGVVFIASVSHLGMHVISPTVHEQTANIRLIAAAPEMLAALRAFVTAWDECLQLEKTDVALRLARAAIAKAEGKPE
ncbi:MAG: hypothetical protein ABFD89_00700 [Bryobacteraceae bacterium]